MKKSVRTCLAAAFAVLAVAIAAWALISQFFGNGNIQVYYTQIDNSKITENHSNGGVIDFTGGLAYSYTLRSYDEDGNGTEIEFGMSRELREGAFIRLEVIPVRGVVNWSEVQYDELPTAVQAHYINPSNNS
ncbi:MAG: YxeA family protein [Oscillospiraceae bacterium]|nr:YxeA family protein [Oscillospiraceae bacterium]